MITPGWVTCSSSMDLSAKVILADLAVEHCALRHIHLLLTTDAAKTKAIGSRLDYCNSIVYGILQCKIDRLQHVQSVLVRVIAEASWTISSTNIHCN